MAGWLEQRTRIPFIGIIAIVVIVAVVASFLKIQMSDLFPSSTITVQSADEAGDLLSGRATSSFDGIREVRLTRQTYMQGVLHRDAAIRFILTPGLLTVTSGEVTEEVEMKSDTVTFEFLGVTRRVTRSGQSLIYIEPGKSIAPSTILLSERVDYAGTFEYHGQRAFQYDPAASTAWIDGDEILLADGAGEWSEPDGRHPVRIEGGLAVIEEIW